MKRCTRCGVEKPEEEFSKDRKSSDGKQLWCKQCIKDYRTINKEHLQEKARDYRERNKEIIEAKKREYYLEHQDEIIQKRRTHRIVNRDVVLRQGRKCHARHKELRNAKSREYDATHREEKAKYNKEYLIENKEKVALQKREHRIKNIEVFTKKGREYYEKNKEVIIRQHGEYQRTPEGKMVAARSGHKRRHIIRNVECTLTLSQWNKIIELQNNRCVLCGKLFTKKNPATKDHIIPVIPYNGPFTMENTQALHKSCNSKKCNRLDKSNIVVWISALAQEG